MLVLLLTAEKERVRVSESSSGGKASAHGGGNGAPLQLRAQLHRLIVEQILQEHATILNDTACAVDEATKVSFMNKCIEHMKEVRLLRR